MYCSLKSEKVMSAESSLNILRMNINLLEREEAEDGVSEVLGELLAAKKLCDDCGQYTKYFDNLCAVCYLSLAERQLHGTK